MHTPLACVHRNADHVVLSPIPYPRSVQAAEIKDAALDYARFTSYLPEDAGMDAIILSLTGAETIRAAGIEVNVAELRKQVRVTKANALLG